MQKRYERIRKLVFEGFALLTLELLIILIFSIISAFIFIGVAYLLVQGNVQAWDNRVFDWITTITTPELTLMMQWFTFLGNREFIIFPAVFVFIYFLFIKPHRWYLIHVSVISIGSISLNLIMKWWFARPRPAELIRLVPAHGLSFPSGHAMVSLTFYGLLLYLVWKYVKFPFARYFLSLILALIIFFIGISRVYLKVHYPSDVLAGFAAGFVWLVVSILVLRQLEAYFRRREQQQAKEM